MLAITTEVYERMAARKTTKWNEKKTKKSSSKKKKSVNDSRIQNNT